MTFLLDARVAEVLAPEVAALFDCVEEGEAVPLAGDCAFFVFLVFFLPFSPSSPHA